VIITRLQSIGSDFLSPNTTWIFFENPRYLDVKWKGYGRVQFCIMVWLYFVIHLRWKQSLQVTNSYHPSYLVVAFLTNHT